MIKCKLHNIEYSIRMSFVRCAYLFWMLNAFGCSVLNWNNGYWSIALSLTFEHLSILFVMYLPELCIVHGNINTTAAIQVVNKYARKLTIRSIGGNKVIPFAVRSEKRLSRYRKVLPFHISFFIMCMEIAPRTIEIDDDMKISITLLLFTQQFTMV